MISIFQKKRYLADYLEGSTDFHNHILPGIDDGAATVEDSLDIIKEFGELGIKDFVATPHVMGEFYPNDPETIRKALSDLKEKTPSDVSISASGEYMMDQFLIDQLENKDVLPLVDKKVLVEMSYFQPPINLNEILFKLQNSSFQPILAHPERYAFYHSKNLENYKELKERGCTFQLNMLSLSAHYGGQIQRIAYKLLEEEMIDFISSDAHKVAHLEKIKNIKLSKKQIQLLEPVIEKSKALFS